MVKDERKQKGIFGMVDSGILFSLSIIAIIIIPEIFRFIINLFVTGIVGGEGERAEEIMNQTSVIVTVMLIRYAVMFLCIVIYSRKKNINLIKSSGLNKKPDYFYTATTPFAGFAMLFTFYPIVQLFMLILEKTGYTEQALGFFSINSGLTLFAGIVVLCLIPAFCEELLFRGAILSGLRQRGNVFAVLISSLLFSIYHQNLQQTVYQFILGVILAAAVIKTGRVYISMLIHFFSNLVVILVEYFNNTLPGGTGIGIGMGNSDWIMFGIGIGIFALLVLFNIFYKSDASRDKLEISDIEVLEGAYPNKDKAVSKIRNRMFWLYSLAGILICAVMWITTLAMGFA